jgi:hypothetical protein
MAAGALGLGRGDAETRDNQTAKRDERRNYLATEKETLTMENIRSHKELRVYQAAIDAAMRIFEITKRFLPEEPYSMADQMRRASRSVCSNIGEAWRKRRYPAHFASKLSDSEGEA